MTAIVCSYQAGNWGDGTLELAYLCSSTQSRSLILIFEIPITWKRKIQSLVKAFLQIDYYYDIDQTILLKNSASASARMIPMRASKTIGGLA